MLAVLSDEEDDSGCGWLAGWLGWQPNQKSVEEEH